MKATVASGNKKVACDMYGRLAGFVCFPSSAFRVVTLLCLMLCCSSAFAQHSGGVNYKMGARALTDMYLWVMTLFTYVMDLLLAISAILIIYNATGIYIKMNTGEGGIVKSVFMLVGACIFMITVIILLPGFFGFNYAGSAWSFRRFW